jgi:radical SAM-linked protein
MRFASHRDVARVFERGVRRAGLPIAYSAGFTPHPRISYAGGAPTGVASEAEYLTLALTSRQAATWVRERLNETLPDGIDVIDVIDAAPGANAAQGSPGGQAPSLQFAASQWRVVLPGVELAAAERAVAGFLALSEAPVERLTDKGVRRLDARAAVVTLDVLGSADPDGGPRAVVTGIQDCAILRMVVLHTAPNVRAEDVLTALGERYGLVPSVPPIITRLAQGSLALLAGQTVLWRRCCGAGEP